MVMERTGLVHRPSDVVSDHREVIRAIEPAVGESLDLLVAIDKAWHEAFYTRALALVLEHDAAGGIVAFQSMIRGLIAMPGRLMDDGRDTSQDEPWPARWPRRRSTSAARPSATRGWPIRCLPLSRSSRRWPSAGFAVEQYDRIEADADDGTGGTPLKSGRGLFADALVTRFPRLLGVRRPKDIGRNSTCVSSLQAPPGSLAVR